MPAIEWMDRSGSWHVERVSRRSLPVTSRAIRAKGGTISKVTQISKAR